MTLIEQYSGDGRLIGRCDARCYEAKHPRCDCICGGRNHGAGFNKALENTRAMFEEDLPAGARVVDDLPPAQVDLFGADG